jgi:hypothetical protein
MLNYSGAHKNLFLLSAEVPAKEDCRAYKVFKHFIDKLVLKHGCEESDVFMFDDKKNKDGAPGHMVYCCGYCHNPERRDPAKYDVFDGMSADGSVEDIGIGNELPAALRGLNADERMALSVLKVSNIHLKLQTLLRVKALPLCAFTDDGCYIFSVCRSWRVPPWSRWGLASPC